MGLCFDPSDTRKEVTFGSHKPNDISFRAGCQKSFDIGKLSFSFNLVIK